MQIVTDTFTDFLVKNFFKEQKYIKTFSSNSDWREIGRSIQQREIRSHFSGHYYAGIICRHTPIRILIFDIDCHNVKQNANLVNRKKNVIKKFGNPDFIYTSPNDGLHLYYFLEIPSHPKEIQQVVKNLIKIKSGEIEFFPNGSGIRLFGGKNCHLLDNNLNPVHIEFQEYIQNVWDLNERLNLNELKSDVVQKKFSQNFISECEHLIKDGLQFPSTRNDELMRLSRYYQGYKRFSQSETERLLCKWISTKNNSLSKDWNRNPQEVYKHIHGIVIRYNPDKLIGLRKYSFPRQILSYSDSQFLHDKAIIISDVIDKPLNNIEDFLKDLFAYCKYNHIDGEVEIPKGVFQNCKNGSGNRYAVFKRALVKSQLLAPVKNYSTTSHKCIKYKLLFEFE